MDLVTQHKNELVVSHRVIAKATDNQEKSILDLITRYKDGIESFGTLAILNRKTNGRPQTEYLLSEVQSTS